MPTKPTNTSLPVHPIRAFTWQGKEGVTEVSSLKLRYWDRVWSDSADLGFLVQGEQLAMKLFVYTRDIRGSEGELAAWEFASNDGFTVRIFND